MASSAEFTLLRKNLDCCSPLIISRYKVPFMVIVSWVMDAVSTTPRRSYWLLGASALAVVQKAKQIRLNPEIIQSLKLDWVIAAAGLVCII